MFDIVFNFKQCEIRNNLSRPNHVIARRIELHARFDEHARQSSARDWRQHAADATNQSHAAHVVRAMRRERDVDALDGTDNRHVIVERVELDCRASRQWTKGTTQKNDKQKKNTTNIELFSWY